MSHRFHHGPLAPLHTERAFPEPALWAVVMLITVLLAIGLAGCASTGWSLTQGGMSEAATTAGSDHSSSYACRKYDPVTGNMTDEVIVLRNLAPNAAVVAMTGAAIQGAIGLFGAAKAAVPVPGAAASARGIPSNRQLDVPTCLGEHGVNTPMPNPPNPTPPQQGSQQQSGREPGSDTRAYALASNPFVPAEYESDYRSPLQRRIADAASRTETQR